MSTQNLKFIHLSTGSALTHKADTGAIIFEKASGRIAVANGSDNVEYYGGGRIADAKFENSILTISFNNGDPAITLDFSDVASTSGVNKILGQLRTDVNAIGGRVTTLEGRATTLEGKVGANETAIQANTAAIADINNESTGILATAKGYTDTEVKKLKDSHDALLQGLRNDVNSNDTDIAALQTLHAKDGETMKTVKEEIDAKVGTGITGTVEAYVEGKVGTINSNAEALGGRVTALETKVGDSNSGLVKGVADNATAITALQGLHADNGAGGKKNVATEVSEGVNAKVGDIKLNDVAVTVKEYVDAGDAKALADAKKYTDGKVSDINAAAGALGTRVDTLETSVGKSTDAAKADGSVYARIAKNAADIATLVGSDAGKSARTIANEELAAQLIPENAKESLDTLKEIAAWIQTHPDDASKMNGKITALETAVGDSSNGLVKDVADNKTAINVNAGAIAALKKLHVDGKTVKQEVTDGIAAIPEASDFDGTDVKVTVKTAAGSVSDVIVDASVLRNDLGQKTAAASADTAFGRIKALETTVGDKDSGLVKGVADNASAIKALQDAQASGSLMWSVWD